MSKKLNRIKCANCGDILVSRNRHDWVACSCFGNGNENLGCFVDGGNEYCRLGGKLENILVFKNRKWVKLELK